MAEAGRASTGSRKRATTTQGHAERGRAATTQAERGRERVRDEAPPPRPSLPRPCNSREGSPVDPAPVKRRAAERSRSRGSRSPPRRRRDDRSDRRRESRDDRSPPRRRRDKSRGSRSPPRRRRVNRSDRRDKSRDDRSSRRSGKHSKKGGGKRRVVNDSGSSDFSCQSGYSSSDSESSGHRSSPRARVHASKTATTTTKTGQARVAPSPVFTDVDPFKHRARLCCHRLASDGDVVGAVRQCMLLINPDLVAPGHINCISHMFLFVLNSSLYPSLQDGFKTGVYVIFRFEQPIRVERWRRLLCDLKFNMDIPTHWFNRKTENRTGFGLMYSNYFVSTNNDRARLASSIRNGYVVSTLLDAAYYDYTHNESTVKEMLDASFIAAEGFSAISVVHFKKHKVQTEYRPKGHESGMQVLFALPSAHSCVWLV